MTDSEYWKRAREEVIGDSNPPDLVAADAHAANLIGNWEEGSPVFPPHLNLARAYLYARCELKERVELAVAAMAKSASKPQAPRFEIGRNLSLFLISLVVSVALATSCVAGNGSIVLEPAAER